MPSPEQLRRMRLAAQRLSPGTEAADAVEAAAAVCGVQAQDLRAAKLALRSRVPGLTRAQIEAADLVRTWTVRGTIHLLPAADLPWMHALVGPRFHAWMQRTLDKRGALDTARGMLDDLLQLIAERPRDRAEILRELSARGHPDLGPGPVNLLMPWVALQGLARGKMLPGGGILKAVVLARGRAVGTWKLVGSGGRRRLEAKWFGRPAAGPGPGGGGPGRGALARAGGRPLA